MTIDVSDVLLSPEFVNTITVIRRAEAVGNNGRSMLTPTTFPNVQAVVTPTAPNQLRRDEDKQLMGKHITVITQFRLQGPSPGYQPDFVVWGGDNFVVTDVNDYTGFGAGFVEAVCSSTDLVDQAP